MKSTQDLVRTSDIVRSELAVLHDTDMLSWREIAELPEYKGIPAGTLCAIYKGYPVPKKWYKRFEIPAPVEINPCPTCGEVHTKKTCPRTRNGKPTHYVVSLGYIPEGERDPYRQLTPDQRRQAMDNFIKEMED